MSLQSGVDELRSAISQSLSTNYLSVSSVAFLYYDFVISLRLEVDHIWKSKWTLVKVLYLLARYLGLAEAAFVFFVDIKLQPSKSMCNGYLWISIFGGSVLIAQVVNAIFILRIHALYGHSRKALISLVCVFALNFVPSLYALITRFRDEQLIQLPIPLPLAGCLVDEPHDEAMTSLSAWVPNLFISFVFFILTFIKFISYIHSQGPRLGNRRFISPLQMTFFQDGTVFFLLLFSMILAAALVDELSINNSTVLERGVAHWLLTITSFSGARLILNLRESAAQANNPGSVMSISVMHFSDIELGRGNETFSSGSDLQSFELSHRASVFPEDAESAGQQKSP